MAWKNLCHWIKKDSFFISFFFSYIFAQVESFILKLFPELFTIDLLSLSYLTDCFLISWLFSQSFNKYILGFSWILWLSWFGGWELWQLCCDNTKLQKSWQFPLRDNFNFFLTMCIYVWTEWTEIIIIKKIKVVSPIMLEPKSLSFLIFFSAQVKYWTAKSKL